MGEEFAQALAENGPHFANLTLTPDFREKGTHVFCECERCRLVFGLRYFPDGSYEYEDGGSCDCDADFSPMEGYPSISEFTEMVKNLSKM